MGAFSQKNGCLQMILGQKKGCLRHKTRSEKRVPFKRAIPYPACVCGFLKNIIIYNYYKKKDIINYGKKKVKYLLRKYFTQSQLT